MQYEGLYLVWSMKTDMQGLTIAIFRQKLNFFFGKIFVYIEGVLKILGFLVSVFLFFSDVFGFSDFLFLQIFFVR